MTTAGIAQFVAGVFAVASIGLVGRWLQFRGQSEADDFARLVVISLGISVVATITWAWAKRR